MASRFFKSMGEIHTKVHKKNFAFFFVVGINLPSGKDNFWLMFYPDNFRSKIIIYLTETINKVA